MRKWIPVCALITTVCLLTACSKEKSVETGTSTPGTGTGGGAGTGGGGGTTPSGNTFEAKLNGQLTIFDLSSATLLRSTPDNLKRLDIAGVSKDGTKRLIITIGDSPATGNGVTLKTYIINLFNEDDPNTPEDESEGNDDGFITYSESIGANNWLTDIYAETGTMKVTACDAAAKKVSGTFNVRDSSLTDATVINITEGKFNNIPYVVLN